MDELKQDVVSDDEAWASVLELCGDKVRSDIKTQTKDSDPYEHQVNARSYTLKRAAQIMGVRTQTLTFATRELALDSFVDPRGNVRYPVHTFDPTAKDPDLREMVAGYERLRPRDLRMLLDLKSKTLNKRLRQIGITTTHVVWRDVRGMWDLPETYDEYVASLGTIKDEQQQSRQEHRSKKRDRRRKAREERSQLRNRLIDAFPNWRYPYRDQQKIYMHIGEPNSGKTYDALQALKQAESGWYLAPLRLLAYEIYDRLNAEGVPCNLLTGEEHISVEGATITAATIEMFNPQSSGECVIIDEAQMLADSDRGWAWTRAMMASMAREMHIIGPATARILMEVLASAAEIQYEIVEHQRLAPIKVADKHYPLEALPPHTILVAFTRQGVLDLKTKLERLGRSVSVVYGSLPPEVRRRQADRFANGETEICVATDAVGMGLNLPADVVCFYEVEKFDGKNVRQLNPSEVHQIGGRAGRYGLSQAGLITGTNKHHLKILKKLYETEPEILTHARVAPTVDDLSLIPGNLAEQLTQWAALDSIPDALRAVIRTSDLAERVELAKMLSDEQIAQLGLASALQLVNAPTRRSTRQYWLDCAYMIMEGYQIPIPPVPPLPIMDSQDLAETELAISCADIYLWLARRQEFSQFGEAQETVRDERREWSLAIDEALLKKLDTAKRCIECGKILPSRHRFRICDSCHFDRQF